MSNFTLPQKVTYWDVLSVDGDNIITYSPGIAVAARWMRKDGTTTDENGREQKTTHLVYSRTLIEKRTKVALSDLDGTAAPPSDAREVIDNLQNPSMSDMHKMVL